MDHAWRANRIAVVVSALFAIVIVTKEIIEVDVLRGKLATVTGFANNK